MSPKDRWGEFLKTTSEFPIGAEAHRAQTRNDVQNYAETTVNLARAHTSPNDRPVCLPKCLGGGSGGREGRWLSDALTIRPATEQSFVRAVCSKTKKSDAVAIVNDLPTAAESDPVTTECCVLKLNLAAHPPTHP
jgi:hypothetical protein